MLLGETKSIDFVHQLHQILVDASKAGFDANCCRVVGSLLNGLIAHRPVSILSFLDSCLRVIWFDVFHIGVHMAKDALNGGPHAAP